MFDPTAQPRVLRSGGGAVDYARRTLIMGVLNVTPDSFSDGGTFLDPLRAAERAREMAADGADLIDIGGESSRPGAEPVSDSEELARILPVLENVLADNAAVPISIDTYKPAVARECLKRGAFLINDITGLSNPRMAEAVAEYGAAVCIMHMKGTPGTMQRDPRYDDVVGEVLSFLAERAEFALKSGIAAASIVIDPGLGFGKTMRHNLEVLRRLQEFTVLGYPVLVGASRKSFIGKILNDAPPSERLEGTAAAVAISIWNGANVVRVHDVSEMAKVARVADAVRYEGC